MARRSNAQSSHTKDTEKKDQRKTPRGLGVNPSEQTIITTRIKIITTRTVGKTGLMISKEKKEKKKGIKTISNNTRTHPEERSTY